MLSNQREKMSNKSKDVPNGKNLGFVSLLLGAFCITHCEFARKGRKKCTFVNKKNTISVNYIQ